MKLTTLLFSLAWFLMLTSCTQKVSEDDGKKPRIKPITVAVAEVDIPKGAFLRELMVKFTTLNLPESSAPAVHSLGKGLLSKDSLDQKMGEVAQVHIAKGSVIYSHMFAKAEKPRELKIDTGARAFPITLKGVGMAKSFKAGRRVDLVAAYTHGEDDYKEVVSSTITENVTILRSAEKCLAGVGCATTIYLKVMPEEAEKIALAQTVGQLRVTLRSKKDHSLIKLKRITRTDALAGKRSFRAPATSKKLRKPPKAEKATPPLKANIRVR